MAIQITINGTDRTAYLLVNTLRLDWKLGQRSTGQMTIEDSVGAYRPVTGQEVAVFKGGNRIWGGTIDEIDETRIGGAGSVACVQQCLLVGYEGRLDKRFVYQTVYGGHFSIVLATNALVAKAHGMPNGMRLQVLSTGTLPSGLSAGTKYYVVNRTADHFQLSLSSGGAAVSIASVGTGAHTFSVYAGDIVSDILANHCSSEIVNGSGNIQAGLPAGILAIDCLSATDVFNQLAGICGYIWYIDADQNFYFIPRSTYTAPFSLTDSTTNARNITLRRTREDLSNRQFRFVSFAGFAVESDSWAGNSADTEFDLTQPVGNIESMQLDGVDVNLGIWGVDTGKDWYYNVGEYRVRQDAGGAVLTSAQTLEVKYRGFARNLLLVDDATAIAARAAIEGGSGAYEKLVDDSQNADAVGALALAAADVQTFKNITGQLNFESDTDGIRPGQILSAVLTTPAVNASFLIDSVSAQDLDGQLLRYSVASLDGTRIITWVNYFQALASGGGSTAAAAATGSGGSVTSAARDGWNVMTPSGGHVTPDRALAVNQVVSMTANVTVDAPTYTGGSFAAGDEIAVIAIWGSTANYTVAWNATYKGLAGADPSTDANTTTIWVFKYTGSVWQMVSTRTVPNT